MVEFGTEASRCQTWSLVFERLDQKVLPVLGRRCVTLDRVAFQVGLILMSWHGIGIRRKAGTLDRELFLTAVLFETGMVFYSAFLFCFASPREWSKATAPFRAVGARIEGSRSEDDGAMNGACGTHSIPFSGNVKNATLATLAKPNRKAA